MNHRGAFYWILPASLALAMHAAAQGYVRLDVTRWVLTHGRADTLRSVGILTPENPRGQPVDGITPVGTPPPQGATPTVLDVIAAQPDPFRITLQLDAEGRRAANQQAPSALVTAGAIIPSGFTLVVAEPTNPPNPTVGVRWNALSPRFGNGNYYATVSMPGTNIVRGQELFTKEHFDAYTANSLIYEAPDIGNVIVDAVIEGGTSGLSFKTQAPGTLPPPAGAPLPRPSPTQATNSRIVGWADPLELELVEIRQADLPGGGKRIWIQTNLPNSFEPLATRVIRWAAEANSGTRIAEVAGTNVFTVDLPLGPSEPYQQPDEMVKITAVVTSFGFVGGRPGSPFITPLGAPPQSVGLSTWLSSGCTLGDTITVKVEPEERLARSIAILLDASGSMKEDGKMDKAKASADRVLRRLGEDTEVALIVFYDCGDIRVEHAFTTDPTQIIAILPRIQPRSGTPLADGTKFAKDYMRKNASGERLDLIILSDGQETCNGDPISAVQQ